MKNLILSLFAISLAGIAAIAATTAMLNAPVVQNIGPPASDKPAPGTPPVTPPPESPPGTPAPSGKPDSTGGTAKPAGEAGEEVADEDPYEGIAPEDLPPDLQYDADSSVSFPTNI
jgi:hypothetical protein